MNKNIIIILTILILPVCFYYYLNNTKAISATQNIVKNKPTIIKFASNMCGECQKMEKVIDKVYPKYKNIELINVQVQKQDKNTKEMIKKYNVTLIPTIIYIKSNGQIMDKSIGSMSEADFENYLKRLVNE